MEFTTQMFVDLAYKSGFLVAYALAIVVLWIIGEMVVGSFRRSR